MQNTGRSGGLNGIEIIDGVVMAEEEWTPQNVGLFETGALSPFVLLLFPFLSHRVGNYLQKLIKRNSRA